MTTPVLIVGAGPVGLTAALALAARGVPSVLVERGDGRPCVGSRSIAVARWTLETFERIGCGRQMAEEGLTWTLGRTFVRDTELFQIRLPASTEDAFPPFVNLPQARVEEILLALVARSPLVQTRWEHRVVGLEQDDHEVRVRVEHRGRASEITAEWVLGCDGQHSSVRELLGIEFAGHSHPDKFLIVDLRAELPYPRERRFFFDHPANPGRQVLIHPQPGRVWRIDWQVPADVDLDHERDTGRLHDRITRVIGPVPYEIVWTSLYVFHQRRARRFADRRVFLVGDAAHVFAPFGGRGMNSGIDDAENLAWKLWLVTAGLAPPELLGTYESERGAAADHNLAVTDATMRFLAPRTRTRRVVRRLLLRACVPFPRLRRHVNSGRLSEPFSYPDSPIAPDAGHPAPDARCAVAGCRTRLRDQFGSGFVVILFAPASVPQLDPELPPTRLLRVAPEASDEPDVVADPDGVIAARYGTGPAGAVVVRPDGHVAARLSTADPAAIERALRLASGHDLTATASRAARPSSAA